MLRKGERLEADAAQTLGQNELGVDEPLPLYTAFEPFEGDARAAFVRGRVMSCTLVVIRCFRWVIIPIALLLQHRAGRRPCSAHGRGHI